MTKSSSPERIKEALADFLRHPHKSSRPRPANRKNNRKGQPWFRKRKCRTRTRPRTKMPLFFKEKDT